MADDLRELVRAERRLRGMSVRAAAASGGCSNTTWTTFEAGGPLGNKIRVAVVKAFDWDDDWPENPPPSRVKQPAVAGEATVAQVLGELRALRSDMDRSAKNAVRAIDRNHEDLVRLDALVETILARLPTERTARRPTAKR